MKPASATVVRYDSSDEWKRYAVVYALIESVPFVRALHERHLTAVRSCKKVLDAGCGPGLLTEKLARAHSEVVALDCNSSMLELAMKRMQPYDNSSIVWGDVCSLPFPDASFDGYVSNNVLHFIEDADAFFAEMIRVLKPGSIVSLSSALPGCDMSILLGEMFRHFQTAHMPPEIIEKARQIARANCALMKQVTQQFNPDEIASLLEAYGFRAVLQCGTAYLDQSFFVVAKK